MSTTSADNAARGDEQQYLDQAIAQVTGMLTKKRAIWVGNSPTFAQFDAHQELGVDPIQFGLAMANLKMNRLKQRYKSHANRLGGDFVNDPDAEDSLVDLASYAILTLGLLKRGRAKPPAFIEKFFHCNGDPADTLAAVLEDKAEEA